MPQMLNPVQPCSLETQADHTVLRAREGAVAARTQLINLVRGTVKSFGERLPKSGTEAFAKKAGKATSHDGTHWDTDHSRVAFPASHRKDRFDGRYTSTPSVLSLEDRYLMYYSARDWNTEYIDAQGRKRIDKSSPYAHIGVAEIRKPPSDR